MSLFLFPTLLLILLISTTSVDAFSWPGRASKECVRSVKAVAYSTSTYAANSPIEDRHIVVDEQSPSLFSMSSSPSLPLFHAAVFDGHGGSEVAEMVKNNLVGKVKETIAKLPPHAQKDETVVSKIKGGRGMEGRKGEKDLFWVYGSLRIGETTRD